MSSKAGYLQRYLIIIDTVRREKYISLEKLIDAVNYRMSFVIDGDNFSKRTIQRDLREIRDELCIDIQYSKTNNGYFIRYRNDA